MHLQATQKWIQVYRRSLFIFFTCMKMHELSQEDSELLEQRRAATAIVLRYSLLVETAVETRLVLKPLNSNNVICQASLSSQHSKTARWPKGLLRLNDSKERNSHGGAAPWEIQTCFKKTKTAVSWGCWWEVDHCDITDDHSAVHCGEQSCPTC